MLGLFVVEREDPIPNNNPDNQNNPQPAAAAAAGPPQVPSPNNSINNHSPPRRSASSQGSSPRRLTSSSSASHHQRGSASSSSSNRHRSWSESDANTATGMSHYSMSLEMELPDFTSPDEMSSVTLIIEGQKLYVHREVLAAWSPVFKSMFVRDFKEKDQREIELPGKKVDDFVELLHCMYPPIKPISDSNVHQLLPLAEEYQIQEIKKKCEEYLLTKPGSMELLVTAQTYRLETLLSKNIEFARKKSYAELQKDPHFASLEPENLIRVLELRVLDLEELVETNKRLASERDARLYGCITELASGYGNFCTDCKTRKVNEACFNCLKMFREKVKAKCEEAKHLRTPFT